MQEDHEETPMAPACLARQARNVRMGDPWQNQRVQIKTCVYLGSQWIHKTAYGRISAELSWGPCCRKRKQFTTALKFGSQIYSYASSHEDSRSKSSSTEWEKLEKIRAWNLTKVRSKKKVIDEARTKGVKVHFASLCRSVIWRVPNWRQSTKKYKGRVVLRGDIVKDDSGSYAVFTKQGSSASQMTGTKVVDIISRTARVRRTSSWRSICFFLGKNGGCSQIIESSKIGMSRHLDPSTTTQMAQIMVQYRRPSRSSWAKFVRSSFGRTVMGKAILDNPIEVRLGEGFQLGMFIRAPWKRVVLICVCGWHKIGW